MEFFRCRSAVNPFFLASRWVGLQVGQKTRGIRFTTRAMAPGAVALS